MTQIESDYEVTIRASRGWFHIDLAGIWRYRDLLFLLVNRDFVTRYKQTILGPLWFVIQPLLMTVVFAVVFGAIANLSTDGLPPMLFYLAGLLGWNYFAQTFQSTSLTLVTNAGMLGKVYFPRLVVPLSSTISNLFAFTIQLATFACFWLWFKFFNAAGDTFWLTGSVVWFPLLLLQIAALSLAVGLWLSALTVKYRDFIFLISFISQVWMYATPVIYPLSQIQKRWQWVAVMNPLAMPIEAMKFMLLGHGVVRADYFAVSVATTAILLVTGVLLFNKVEKTFVDTV